MLRMISCGDNIDLSVTYNDSDSVEVEFCKSRLPFLPAISRLFFNASKNRRQSEVRQTDLQVRRQCQRFIDV